MKPFELKVITFFESFCGYYDSQEQRTKVKNFNVNNDIISNLSFWLYVAKKTASFSVRICFVLKAFVNEWSKDLA